VFDKYYILLNKDIFTFILLSKRQTQHLLQAKSSEFYPFSNFLPHKAILFNLFAVFICIIKTLCIILQSDCLHFDLQTEEMAER
jgi:hypothetical protein